MSDLTEPDFQLMRGIVNRHGRDEMAQAFQNILERLETLEAIQASKPPWPPGGGKPPEPEVDPSKAEEQAADSPVEGETGSEEEVSSSPPSEPATQTQTQSY